METERFGQKRDPRKELGPVGSQRQGEHLESGRGKGGRITEEERKLGQRNCRKGRKGSGGKGKVMDKKKNKKFKEQENDGKTSEG